MCRLCLYPAVIFNSKLDYYNTLHFGHEKIEGESHVDLWMSSCHILLARGHSQNASLSKGFSKQKMTYWFLSTGQVSMKSYSTCPAGKSRVLTIYTNHPGGNLVHKHQIIKLDVIGESPATK